MILKKSLKASKNRSRENHASASRIDIGLQGRFNDVVPFNTNKRANLVSNVSNDEDWRAVA